MKKIIYSITFTLITLFLLFICYFSLIGFETKKFNNQINNKIKGINKDLEIEINQIKIILNPFNFQINTKTLGTKLKHKNESIDFENIQSKISLKSLLENRFSISNLKISTKSLEVKKLISFIQSLNSSTELFILEKLIKKGYLIADLNIDFDEDGNFKNNYKIDGILKDVKLNILNNNKIEKLNLNFNLDHKNLELRNLKFFLNGLELKSNQINVNKKKQDFKFLGEIENRDLTLSKETIDLITKTLALNIKVKKLRFKSKNNFSFILTDKFKIKDLEVKSQIDIINFLIPNNYKLKKIFPKINKDINFSDQKLEINFKDNSFTMKGAGDILLQNQNDKINYLITKKNKLLKFDTIIKIKKNPFNIDFFDYEKDIDTEAILKINGIKEKNNQIRFKVISLSEKNNKMEVNDLLFDKNLKIIDLKNATFDFLDNQKNINKFNLIKKKNNYYLKGPIFNAYNLIENILSDNKSQKILSKDFKIFVSLDKLILDQNYDLKKFKGSLSIKNQEINNGNLVGVFSNGKRFDFNVNSKDNKKITTLFVDEANSIVSRYKFIKGFKGGVLDFYSSSQNDESVSTIKIYDFKLKELPALTKLLTLASLQGIADLLSGEGIGFDEFEMNFSTKGNIMTIEEIYSIGPAISILIDGYVEKDKLISLRGTLVPATTINKAIGSIPILGKILVGDKTGEGVFGVSFKIKGPPKSLETTVNPIKTLTPRFITRTLEKIKKN